ncbi:hypothetical protein GBAR_LOCUS24743, partial [Geodia barretti]
MTFTQTIDIVCMLSLNLPPLMNDATPTLDVLHSLPQESQYFKCLLYALLYSYVHFSKGITAHQKLTHSLSKSNALAHHDTGTLSRQSILTFPFP